LLLNFPTGDNTTSKLGSTTGSCSTAPTDASSCYYGYSFFCTDSATSPTSIKFFYSSTGYQKVSATRSGTDVTVASLPTEATALEAKACSWSDANTILGKGNNYFASCILGSSLTAGTLYMYYGSSPDCKASTDNQSDAAQQCTRGSGSSGTGSSGDCATGATLDSFLSGTCSCASKYFQVDRADYNIKSSGTDNTATTIGSTTGSCGTAPTNVSECGIQDSVFCVPAVFGKINFFYSSTGYQKVSLLGYSPTSLPSEVSATEAKACVWKDMNTKFGKGPCHCQPDARVAIS
jgi:hypothetical protein